MTDAPTRCLRCHRPLRPDAKRPAVRGIGPTCWRLMQRAKDADPGCKTLNEGPDVVLFRDEQGRLHHNVADRVGTAPIVFGAMIDIDNPEIGPPEMLRLAASILIGTGLVRTGWLPHLAPVFYDEFLRDVPDDGTIIRGADIRAWILEHTRRGDA